MPITLDDWDWKRPDYVALFRKRLGVLARLRSDSRLLDAFKVHYKECPADFITDWGLTFDPRNPSRDDLLHPGKKLPAMIPFVLFKRQIEWVDWALERWRNQENGLTPKSREKGMSWLSVAFACTLCLFNEGLVIGFGSRKEEYVDKLGSPKALFPKARLFLSNLPVEFLGGWDVRKHASHMRIMFPGTNSIITGEAGDNIGRGDRASIYVIDEAAYLERPELVEASLSNTTNCRIDISSANGMANPFAQKVHANPDRVFSFHWRDDPRKDDEWYEKQVKELANPVVVAQEIDINFMASVEGMLIPSSWVQSAIDAVDKLGVVSTGEKIASFDVADEGRDTNVLLIARGAEILSIDEWTGKGNDIYGSVERVFNRCEIEEVDHVRYDADGLGASVRGDARKVNEAQKLAYGIGAHSIYFEPFRGSGAVERPESEDVKSRKNKDFFSNAKAQAWWALRRRFELTHLAVQGEAFEPDNIISIPRTIPLLNKLILELAQPTYTINNAGKIVVDKTPEGARSPNLADAVMIRFNSFRSKMAISGEAMQRFTSPILPGRIVVPNKEYGVSAEALTRFAVRR